MYNKNTSFWGFTPNPLQSSLRPSADLKHVFCITQRFQYLYTTTNQKIIVCSTVIAYISYIRQFPKTLHMVNKWTKFSPIITSAVNTFAVIQTIYFNWDSLHARLDSHYRERGNKKKKHKKIKVYRKSA